GTRVEARADGHADAAAVPGTSEERGLQLVEAGRPERAPILRRPGARALTFQDLVLLRNAKRLVDQAIAPARVADALRQARARHPAHRPVSALRLETAGQQIVLREGAARVAADSGQVLLDLDVTPSPPPAPAPDLDALSPRPAPLPARAPLSPGPLPWGAPPRAGPGWLPPGPRARARVPPDAHVTRGRLPHEGGRLAGAQTPPRAPLPPRPADATAAY